MKFCLAILFALALVSTLAACRNEDGAVQSFERKLAAGKRLYAAHCAACHQADGQGLAGAFPPLAASSYLADGAGPAISAVLDGLSGAMEVNGSHYNSAMPAMSYLDDGEVAKILTYVMNSWGNPGGDVNAPEVAAVRGN